MNLDNNFEIPADFYYISTLLLDIRCKIIIFFTY